MILDYEIHEVRDGNFIMLIWPVEGAFEDDNTQMVAHLEPEGFHHGRPKPGYIEEVTKRINASIFMGEFCTDELYEKGIHGEKHPLYPVTGVKTRDEDMPLDWKDLY